MAKTITCIAESCRRNWLFRVVEMRRARTFQLLALLRESKTALVNVQYGASLEKLVGTEEWNKSTEEGATTKPANPTAI